MALTTQTGTDTVYDFMTSPCDRLFQDGGIDAVTCVVDDAATSPVIIASPSADCEYYVGRAQNVCGDDT